MYRLNNSRVLFEDRPLLTRDELQQFLWHALTRKQHAAGRMQKILVQLDLRRRASHAQSFSSYYARGHAKYLKLCVWKDSDGKYSVCCFGNRAEWAIDRANEGPARYAAKLERRKKKSAARNVARPRRNKPYRPKGRPQKRAPSFIPAPISLKRKEKLVRQYRKHEIPWLEAKKLVEVAFRVRGNWKYTASQVVSFQLFSSLERSGERFAQFSRRGFCVRFDLVDGLWRNDLTRVTVHCTKDNASPVYRRLRKELRSLALPTGADRKNERRRTHRRLRRQRILLAVA